MCGAEQPATASGVAIIYVFSVLRACRRHPGRRNTRLRTAATACRGGGNVRLLSSSSPFVIIIAFCHRLRRRRWGCDTSRPRNQMQIPPIQWMINQPNRRRWDAIHIYIDTNIEKWNPHGVGAIAIGSDARLRNPKSLRILTFLEKMDGVEERKSPVNRGFTGLGGEDEIRTRGRITPTTV